MAKASGIIFISIFIPFAVDIASFRGACLSWQPFCSEGSIGDTGFSRWMEFVDFGETF
jgi:hypothetical protein